MVWCSLWCREVGGLEEVGGEGSSCKEMVSVMMALVSSLLAAVSGIADLRGCDALCAMEKARGVA